MTVSAPRLVEAAQAFRGELAEPDPILRGLLGDIDRAEHAACARKLDIAAQWMDQAAVSTIHSWCQRMLREHAFDSGSLFEQSLETDQSDLLAEVVRDYWRQHCYALQGDALGWVNANWKNPEALGQQVRRWLDQYGEPEQACLQTLLEEPLQQAATALQQIRLPWQAWLDALQAFFDSACEAGQFNANKLKASIYQPRLDQLRAWCQGETELSFAKDNFKRFTHEGLHDACRKGVAA